MQHILYLLNRRVLHRPCNTVPHFEHEYKCAIALLNLGRQEAYYDYGHRDRCIEGYSETSHRVVINIHSQFASVQIIDTHVYPWLIAFIFYRRFWEPRCRVFF